MARVASKAFSLTLSQCVCRPLHKSSSSASASVSPLSGPPLSFTSSLLSLVMPPELPETSFKSLMGETFVSVQHWLKKKGGMQNSRLQRPNLVLAIPDLNKFKMLLPTSTSGPSPWAWNCQVPITSLSHLATPLSCLLLGPQWKRESRG